MNKMTTFKATKAKSFCLASVLAAIIVATGCTMAASQTSIAQEFVVLENTDSGDVSYISVPDHKVVKTVKLEKYLDDISASSDGKTLYVNSVVSLGNPLMRHAGEKGKVFALDTLSGKVKWVMEIDGWPHHMTLSADDKYLFVPLFDEMAIVVIDVERQVIVKRIQAPLGSHGTRLSPDGTKLYVGSMLMDLIVSYDLVSGELDKAIPFKNGIRPFTITKDEKRMYVQLSLLNGFKVIDLETEKVIREVAMPALPEGTILPTKYPQTVNHGLELSPDEKYLLAAGSISKTLAIFSHPDLELVKTIPVGDEPNWIIFSEDSKYAYVSNRKSDDLSVIDMETLEEIKRIPVGDRPQRMRFVSISED